MEYHPEDTDELHLKLATEAVVKGKNANRTYIFIMHDRVEIAFGQTRSLLGQDMTEEQRSFFADYHTGLILSIQTVRDLYVDLGRALDAIDGATDE